MGRIAGEGLVDQVDQPDRQRRSQVSEVGRIALQAGERGVGIGLAQEWHASGEALVQHQPERVQVGATIEAATAHLLGREVLGRTHHDVVAGEVLVARFETLGDAEVGQQHPSVGRDEDVARLDVAVHESGAVRLVERTGDRRADVDRQFGTEPLLRIEQLAQTLAVDELHHDRLAAFVDDDVVHGDDVGMTEAGDGDRFAPESLGDDRIAGQIRLQPLDRDLAVEVVVGRHPHFGHASLTDPAFESVTARQQFTCWRVRGRCGTRGHDRMSR